MKLNGHPAPGLKGRLGYYMGARFSIPENPVRPGANQSGPSICALKTIDRIGSIPRAARVKNALSGAFTQLSGCATATPVMRTSTGQVQAVEEPVADTPLWIHIAVGGIISAIALAYIGKGR